jgi:hypothetical protein
VTVQALLWFALAAAFYIVINRLWLWGADEPPETTLHNPGRLREVLRQFTRSTPDAPSRHQRQRTEAQCREMLEWMLQTELPKCRPDWLVNPTTKRRLELDMYSAKERLAFEYDGAQHDNYTPHWHRGNEHHFAYRCLLDQLKGDLCKANGVRLLRIPWHSVSAGNPERTARFLERLLYSGGIPFRSALVTSDGPLAPSQFERRCPSRQSLAAAV